MRSVLYLIHFRPYAHTPTPVWKPMISIQFSTHKGHRLILPRAVTSVYTLPATLGDKLCILASQRFAPAVFSDNACILSHLCNDEVDDVLDGGCSGAIAVKNPRPVQKSVSRRFVQWALGNHARVATATNRRSGGGTRFGGGMRHVGMREGERCTWITGCRQI